MKKLIALVLATSLFLLFLPTAGTAAIPDNPKIFLPIVISPDRLDQMQIAFDSDRDVDSEIFVMKGDGSSQIQLTFNSSTDEDPNWSPDGKRLAFVSNRDGDFEIYVMNADGTDPRRLTESPGWDYKATWSPDGARLAFISERDSTSGAGASEIYVMNADGSGQTRLTTGESFVRALAWSPDGNWLAYSQNPPSSGDWLLKKVRPDGSETVPLWTSPSTLSNYGIGDIDWSPDSQELVFGYQDDPLASFSIYLLKADGSQPQPDRLGAGVSPSWSPTGNILAFINFYWIDIPTDYSAQIGLMRTDRSLIKMLTTEGHNFNPDWLP